MTALKLPDTDGRWITPTTVDALLEELELCGVPLDASLSEARRLLELSAVLAPDLLLGRTLRHRWHATGRTEPIPRSPMQRAT
ncbi:hypothetical protein AB0E12_27300 [Micromonospora chersina]|uniref:hypothetical protein n=1 Tax=Micromonospora chersina TaxID=47854 RepID=UPI0033FFE9F2